MDILNCDDYDLQLNQLCEDVEREYNEDNQLYNVCENLSQHQYNTSSQDGGGLKRQTTTSEIEECPPTKKKYGPSTSRYDETTPPQASETNVWGVFRDARRFWRVSSKWTRGRRTETDVHPAALGRPLARAESDSTPEMDPATAPFVRRWTEVEPDEENESAGVIRSDSTSSSGQSECAEEFRARASTDGRLPPRPARPRHPLPTRPLPPPVRRMSVAMRGNNANTY